MLKELNSRSNFWLFCRRIFDFVSTDILVLIFLRNLIRYFYFQNSHNNLEEFLKKKKNSSRNSQRINWSAYREALEETLGEIPWWALGSISEYSDKPFKKSFSRNFSNVILGKKYSFEDCFGILDGTACGASLKNHLILEKSLKMFLKISFFTAKITDGISLKPLDKFL